MSIICNHRTHHVEIASTTGVAYSGTTDGIRLDPAALSAYVGEHHAGTGPWVTTWTVDDGGPADCPEFAAFVTGAAKRRTVRSGNLGVGAVTVEQAALEPAHPKTAAAPCGFTMADAVEMGRREAWGLE